MINERRKEGAAAVTGARPTLQLLQLNISDTNRLWVEGAMVEGGPGPPGSGPDFRDCETLLS